MTEADRRAIRLYQLLASRVVQDLHLTPMVFDIMHLQLTHAEALLLLEQIAVAHEVLSPAPVESSESEP